MKTYEVVYSIFVDAMSEDEAIIEAEALIACGIEPMVVEVDSVV